VANRLRLAGARACLVTGSIARDWADRWSDVELLVVWDATPAPEQRHAALQGLVAEIRAYDGTVPGRSEDDGLIEGLKCDLEHVTAHDLHDSLSRLVESVSSGPDLDAQRLAASLLTGIALYGDQDVGQWREVVADYPDGLARRTVSGTLRLGPHAWLRMLAEREDPLPLNDVLVRIGRTLLISWFALSERYVATTDGKWAIRYAGTLTGTPGRAAERLAACFSLPPIGAAEMMIGLVDETIDFIAVFIGTELAEPIRGRLDAASRDPDWSGLKGSGAS
jgi:hypothetical protein